VLGEGRSLGPFGAVGIPIILRHISLYMDLIPVAMWGKGCKMER
jgi:hypothetical protein